VRYCFASTPEKQKSEGKPSESPPGRVLFLEPAAPLDFSLEVWRPTNFGGVFLGAFGFNAPLTSLLLQPLTSTCEQEVGLGVVGALAASVTEPLPGAALLVKTARQVLMAPVAGRVLESRLVPLQQQQQQLQQQQQI